MNFNDFLGLDIKETYINGKPRVITTSDFDVLNEYLSSQRCYSAVEGRLIVVE